MTLPDFAYIRHLQLKMDRMATDLLVGPYRSAFKGHGVEFEEARPFVAGDEVRAIDWNVTARTGTPFVKTFREERELTIYLLLDLSASMHFGHRQTNKHTLLSELGAALAFSSIKNHDHVGMVLFTDRIEHHLPPKKGLGHVLRLIRDIIETQPQGTKTNLQKALSFLGNVRKRRCVVFLISDFCDLGPWQNSLSVTAKHHDLIALHVYDPLEVSLPPLGLLNARELENGKTALIDTESSSFQKAYTEAFTQEAERAKASVNSSGAAWVSLSTQTPFIDTLRRFFAQKAASRGRH